MALGIDPALNFLIHSNEAYAWFQCFYNNQALAWLSMHKFNFFVNCEPISMIYTPCLIVLALVSWLALVVKVSYNAPDFKWVFLVAGVLD